MPVHDWTRVTAGTFHAFHNAWIAHMQAGLNAGVLPSSYYALGEQRSGKIGPDLLTLHAEEDEIPAVGSAMPSDEGNGGMVAVAESPPQVHLAQEADIDAAFYEARRRTLVIYHATGDRVVALVEIVSRANKRSHANIADFVDKVVQAVQQGIHVLVVDLYPPGKHDPDGIHGVIWDELVQGDYDPPDGLPLTLVSYCAKSPPKAYVEPTAVGKGLTDMPIFLTNEHYVPVPLESTYMQAWTGVPGRWRRVIEGEG